MEIARLFVGLILAMAHRPVADWIAEQDHALVALFRNRGITLPSALGQETTRNLFFAMGIIVACVELGRIYMMIHP